MTHIVTRAVSTGAILGEFVRVGVAREDYRIDVAMCLPWIGVTC